MKTEKMEPPRRGGKSKGEPFPCVYQGRKVAGGYWFEDRRVFEKQVKPEDFFRSLQTYGIDDPNVQALRERGCKEILLMVTGGCTYRIAFETFLEKSKKIDWPARENFRFPLRWYCPLKYWRLVGGGGEPQANGAYTNGPRQGDLFRVPRD